MHAWPEPSPPSWPLQSAPYVLYLTLVSLLLHACRCKLSVCLSIVPVSESCPPSIVITTPLAPPLLINYFYFSSSSFPSSLWIAILNLTSFLFFFFCFARNAVASCNCIHFFGSALLHFFYAASSNTLINSTNLDQLVWLLTLL